MSIGVVAAAVVMGFPSDGRGGELDGRAGGIGFGCAQLEMDDAGEVVFAQDEPSEPERGDLHPNAVGRVGLESDDESLGCEGGSPTRRA